MVEGMGPATKAWLVAYLKRHLQQLNQDMRLGRRRWSEDEWQREKARTTAAIIELEGETDEPT